MNRRHFLSIIAAGLAAPAIVKAENIMRIWTPPEQKIINPFEGMWQDAAGTIPVTAIGQPVGRLEQSFGVLVSPTLASRPTVAFMDGRGYGMQFTGNQLMKSVERIAK